MNDFVAITLAVSAFWFGLMVFFVNASRFHNIMIFKVVPLFIAIWCGSLSAQHFFGPWISP